MVSNFLWLGKKINKNSLSESGLSCICFLMEITRILSIRWTFMPDSIKANGQIH